MDQPEQPAPETPTTPEPEECQDDPAGICMVLGMVLTLAVIFCAIGLATRG